MTKKTICAITFSLLVTVLHGQQQYNEYQMYLVRSFNKGSGENQLGYMAAPASPSGPTSLIIRDNQSSFLVDGWNNRLVFLNDDFEVTEYINVDITALAGNYVYFDNEEVIVANYPVGFLDLGFDLKGNKFFGLSSIEGIVSYNGYRSYWYHNDVLFIHDRDNRLVSIREPSAVSEENRHRFLDTERTRALFEPDSGWDPQGLSIDEQDRLFLDGDLVTLDFRTFSDYWYEYHDGDMSKLSVFGRRIGGNTFIGKDAQGYTYWDAANQFILIFSANGMLIEWFLYDHTKSSTLPAVSPSGDVYFMHYAQDTIDIYRVDRQW